MLSFGAQKPFLLVLFFVLLMVAKSLRIPHHYHHQEVSALKGDEDHLRLTEKGKEELGMELYPTGSSLPDCSHACGPCFPCKRVMVSFKCFTESCPIVYRCMCKGKYYHVPSN